MEPAAAPEADTLVAREAGGRRAGRSASSVRSPRGAGRSGDGGGGVRTGGKRGGFVTFLSWMGGRKEKRAGARRPWEPE